MDGDCGEQDEERQGAAASPPPTRSGSRSRRSQSVRCSTSARSSRAIRFRPATRSRSEALNAGTVVTKLGAAIGRARTHIPAGAHVHRHNLLALAAPGPSRAHPRAAPPAQSLANHFPGFLGYPRPDGRVGTRNMLIVLPTVNCSATVARRIAPAFRGRLEAAPHPGIDGVAALCHAQGCSVRADGPGMAMLRRVLGGLRRAS